MKQPFVLWILGLAIMATASATTAEEQPTYLLQSKLRAGDSAIVEASLEVGGEMLVNENNYEENNSGENKAAEGNQAQKKLPLSVVAKFRYDQRLLTWSADSKEVARSLRYYDLATATIKVDEGGMERILPEDQRLVLAEVRNSRSTLNGLSAPMTRDGLDLIQIVGNTLAIDRLLPGNEQAEGDSWQHDQETLGALLGMDHVAVCEVTSVVTGEENKQVQIRLAGTVHGTIDGTATEIELRGAYLFHLQRKRITKFNLAIKEHRTTGEVAPGLDVVAKLKLTVTPTESSSHIDEKAIAQAEKLAGPISHELRYESPARGVRFRYDDAWYVTAEMRDLLSLRRLQAGSLVAHCNVTTLPARSEGRETSLEQFERDVRESLGDHLDEVAAATKWTTEAGHDCLGIIANGKIKDVPVQWRYYLIASAGMTRVSLAVTVERSQVEQFENADRQIVDSLELIEVHADPVADHVAENHVADKKTASKPTLATPK